MADRLFKIAAFSSNAVWWLCILGWISAASVNPQVHFISIASDCHLSLTGDIYDARITAYSDAVSGPYHGSLIGFDGDPDFPTVTGSGDPMRIYYRDIRWPNGESLWTISVSLLYPIVIFAILPIAWCFYRARRTNREFSVKEAYTANGPDRSHL